MAKPRQEETKDTLGTIFDFIFAETQKPVEKRKPVKYSHVDSASEMVETLSTVLEKPGLYVSDQMAKDLEDGLNIQLAELYLGTSSPQGKTKVGTKDLISIFKDPNDYFDKAYKKANPKLNLAEWSGRTFRGINASNWAKKQGILDKDTRWALNRAAASFDNPSDRLDMVIDGKRMVRKLVAMESVEAACKKYGIEGVAPLLGKYIDSSNDLRTSADLERILRTKANVTDEDLIMEIRRNFASKEDTRDSNGDTVKGYISKMDGFLIGGYKPKPFYGTNENIKTYRTIASQFYTKKANVYSLSQNSEDKKLADGYRKIGLLINNWELSDKKNKEYLLENKKDLKNIQEQMRLLRKSGMSTPEQKRDLARLKEEERKLKSNVSFLQTSRGYDAYFKYKGMWTSMNNIYLHGNLLGSIMDGTFFSDDNKILNPVETDYKGTMAFGDTEHDKGTTIFFNVARKDAIYKISKDGKTFRVRNGNFYNDTMTLVSYLTPQKIFQGNGELFAFLTYKNRMSTFRKFLKASNDQRALAEQLKVLGLFDEEGLMNFSIFGDKDKFADSMQAFEKLLENDKNLLKYFKDNEKALKMLQKYIKTEKLFRRATTIFSARYRTQEWLKDRINDATFKRFRNYIAENWLKKFASDEILGPAISQWAKGAGIQALIRGVVDKFLVGLGLSTGNVIFTAAAGLISSVLSKLVFIGFKVLAELAVIMAIGVVFIFCSGSSHYNSMTMKYGTVSSVTPGEVEQCEGFESEELVNTGDIDIIVPPPSNSSCPLGSASYYCTQGPDGSFSHHGINNKRPVDIALHGSSFYFYAPQYCDNGGCRITSARSAAQWRCLDHSVYVGDEVSFNDGQGNVFIIVHAKALVPIQQEVSGGEAVAYIYGAGELSDAGTCWDGSHLHLEITHNGAYIDPLPFLQAMGCSVPGTSQCPE